MIPHYVVYPSANPKRGFETALKWRAVGYNVIVGLDEAKEAYFQEPMIYPFPVPAPFKGYYRVINKLVSTAFNMGAVVVTCIGDDMDPPTLRKGTPLTADDMAMRYLREYPDGGGVMQPCGDPGGSKMVIPGFEELGAVPNAARICGSPVFGRKWASRPGGPFCEEYRSFYGDEDLWNVARKAENLYLAFDVAHMHNHWSFGKMPKQPYHERAQANWADDKATFERRKAAGFP